MSLNRSGLPLFDLVARGEESETSKLPLKLITRPNFALCRRQVQSG